MQILVDTKTMKPKVRHTKTDRARYKRLEEELHCVADHCPTVSEYRAAEEALAAVNAMWEHEEREKDERGSDSTSETAGDPGADDGATEAGEGSESSVDDDGGDTADEPEAA